MAKHRWLWPSTESKFFRHQFYQNLRQTDYDAPSAEVLVPGSDDELDEDERRVKRRRIVRLGRAFLSGRELLIPSASLKGPFGEPVDENYPPSEADDANDDAGDEMIEGPLAVEQFSHHQSHGESFQSAATNLGEDPGITGKPPLLTPPHVPSPRPEKVQEQDSRTDVRTPSRTPPSSPPSPPSAVADLLAATSGDHGQAEGQAAEPIALSPSTIAGIQCAKRLSMAVIDKHEDEMKGIEEAKRLSQAAMASQESSRTSIGQNEQINDHPEHMGPVVRKSYSSSPFLFRYKNVRNNTERDIVADPLKVAESHQDIDRATPVAADVYDVPMEDENDPVTKHTNRRLSRSSGRRSLQKRDIRRHMRDSGATFEYDKADPPTPEKNSDRAVSQLVSQDATNDVVTATTSPTVQISTQVALQEAHRDLLRSSPRKGILSPIVTSRRPNSADMSQSPAPAITPFAKFHERLAGRKESVEEPQISTQAIFDAFSPFQISPTKGSAPQLSPSQPEKKVRSQAMRTSFTPINKPSAATEDPANPEEVTELDSQSSDRATKPNTTKPAVDSSAQDKTSAAPVADGGWSFAALDNSPSLAKPAKSARGSSLVSQPRPSPGLKDMGFKVTKASSQSQSKSSTQCSSQSQTRPQPPSPKTNPTRHHHSPKPAQSQPHTPSHHHSHSQTTTAPPLLSQRKPSKSQRSKSLPSTTSQLLPSLPPTEAPASRSKTEVNRSHTPSRPQSFSLSQIITDVVSSQPGAAAYDFDLRTALSQASVSSLNKGGRCSLPASSSRRGRVGDWEGGSEGDEREEDGGVGVQSGGSRVRDSMALDGRGQTYASEGGSFTVPSFPASRVRMSFDGEAQAWGESLGKTGLSTGGGESREAGREKGGLKSSLKRKTQKSSAFQDAQREETLDGDVSFDIDASVEELGRSVLGGWDVEEDLRGVGR